MFSILIANYNNGKYFRDCWESILNQTYQDFEVIIVDDCSTDDSVRIINEIIENDNRFKLFQNDQNYGCGYTKWKCVEFATGEICGFLDSDDTLKLDALEIMVDEHSKYPECSIIGSKFINLDKDLNFMSFGINGSAIPREKSYMTYGKNSITAFATFKRRNYLLTDGINKNLKRAVDQDLYYKLEEVGAYVFIDKYLYNYRRIAGSISSNLQKAQYWHTKILLETYKRRKKLNIKIDNYSEKQYNRIKLNYYINRAKLSQKRNLTCHKFYNLLISILVLPFAGLGIKIRLLLNIEK